MNYRAILFIALLLTSAGTATVVAQAEPQDIGATEADYRWWRDARFGIFIHWGPGAFVHKNSLAWEVPPEGRPPYRDLGYMADVENPDDVPPEITSGQYKKYQKPGKVPAGVYNHLYRLFDPVKFDAEEVAQMAMDAGAGYVVFTTKHHDGFCMWDSAYTDYDMMSTALEALLPWPEDDRQPDRPPGESDYRASRPSGNYRNQRAVANNCRLRSVR